MVWFEIGFKFGVNTSHRIAQDYRFAYNYLISSSTRSVAQNRVHVIDCNQWILFKHIASFKLSYFVATGMLRNEYWNNKKIIWNYVIVTTWICAFMLINILLVSVTVIWWECGCWSINNFSIIDFNKISLVLSACWLKRRGVVNLNHWLLQPRNKRSLSRTY